MPTYTPKHATPSLETYTSLRRSTDLGVFSPAAATTGLKNSLFAVQIISSDDNRTVGMGRVIGDGGCFFQVTDIAVDPAHQGRGLGKMVMAELKKWIDGNVPETGYVSLIADGKANALYAQFGFVSVGPVSEGMYLRRKE